MKETPKKAKKNFNWESGGAIRPGDYDTLGNVREVGFNKISNALYADPEIRKKERATQLSGTTNPKSKKEEFLVEQSSSGISDDFSSSNADKLIGKSKKITGLDRFKPKGK